MFTWEILTWDETRIAQICVGITVWEDSLSRLEDKI